MDKLQTILYATVEVSLIVIFLCLAIAFIYAMVGLIKDDKEKTKKDYRIPTKDIFDFGDCQGYESFKYDYVKADFEPKNNRK